MRTRTVGRLLFQGFEPLDTFGPVEAFVVARVPDQAEGDPPFPFRVVTIAEGNAALREFLRAQAPRVEVLASVCADAALLAAAGLLAGLPATTNRRTSDWVAAMDPAAHWDRTARWVDAGRAVTAAGVSAGTDMALHLVGRLIGPPAAVAAARRMEHRWVQPPEDAVS